MRYVAHSQPDALLYALMIRACAGSPTGRSEPERALDLWTEMTVDHGIAPTEGTYNAIILACARSGEKVYVNEAFRLAKEMLDCHRDAEGRSAYEPDQKMFCALLEGAKRVGDLARARWVLAEMVRLTGASSEDEENASMNVKVTAEVMNHIFHAYAAYKPPFQRSAVKLQDDKTLRTQPIPSVASDQPDSAVEQEGLPVEDIAPSFSHMPPQSQSEIIGEAKALFSRIIEDTRPGQHGICPSGKFRYVALTPRLLNAYLSVYYAHSKLQVAQDLFNTLFTELGVKKTAVSFVEALERCGIAQRGQERCVALSFADSVWPEWHALECQWQVGANGVHGVHARFVERAYVAMIRVLTR
jgi:hypothetical protein